MTTLQTQHDDALSVDTSAKPASTPDPFEPHSIGTMVDRVASVAVEKASQPLAFFLRSLVAGAMVAFGVLLSLIVSVGVEQPGIASLLMGLAFGMSFVLILVSGMSLITADMAAGFMALMQRRLGVGSYIRLLAVGLVGNFLGVLAFIAICAAAGGPYLGGLAERASAVASAKTSHSLLTALLLGVLCTWFLQTAMCMYFKARSDMSRMAFAFYGPFAFVIGGTQHVVANIGFLGLPLLLATFHSGVPDLAVSWGLASDGLLTNILITTVGNFIGGTLFVAVPFQLIAWLQAENRTDFPPH